jgi:hypothetical protein
MQPKTLVFTLVSFLASSSIGLAQTRPGVVVEDIFGRRLNENNGLILVDWEGFMANPAIEFVIVPPAGAAYPLQAVLRGNDARLYFNLPSETGPEGPRKELRIARPGKQSAFISIFPDRDDRNELHALDITLRDARGRQWDSTLPVRVIDQDRKEQDGGFPVTVDFSKDKSGFFADEKRRQVVTQAARDWLYFFDGAGLDPVPAGAERSFVRKPDDLVKGDWVFNDKEYTGVKLYVIGLHTSGLHSAGGPSDRGGFQSFGGKPSQLRRSGCIEMETEGNYEERGWRVSLDDSDWWRATNFGKVLADLYSISHHEIGHALFFNPALPLFARIKEGIPSNDRALLDYFSRCPTPDAKDHFPKQLDPESMLGLFGNEYEGQMPRGRWLITKGDLLIAQAVGYRLRATSAFAPLTLESGTIPAGQVGAKYSTRLRASGGIPFYNWEIVGSKKLPPGLRLDSFSGEIQGVPSKAGTFEFTVRVRDYHRLGVGKESTLMLDVKP